MQLKHTRHALGSLKPRQAVTGLRGGIEGAAIHAIWEAKQQHHDRLVVQDSFCYHGFLLNAVLSPVNVTVYAHFIHIVIQRSTCKHISCKLAVGSSVTLRYSLFPRVAHPLFRCTEAPQTVSRLGPSWGLHRAPSCLAIGSHCERYTQNTKAAERKAATFAVRWRPPPRTWSNNSYFLLRSRRRGCGDYNWTWLKYWNADCLPI